MTAYYNEIDPYAAQWLRNLISTGHIAPGVVDERSIEDVRPDEIRGYTQCHFFAGVGIWSLGLRTAGWPDDRPIWTGSCPCQPFSAAGKGDGFDDERHLWPAWHHLIRECRPHEVFGEQVAGKDGLAWFDLVQSDMEANGYATGAVITTASGFGAPHGRSRQYFSAYDLRLAASRLADATSQRQQRPPTGQDHDGRACSAPDRKSGFDRMADTDGRNTCPQRQQPIREQRRQPPNGRGLRGGYRGAQADLTGNVEPGPTNGLWADADWLFCRDGKCRPVEPGTFPLAHGVANRVGQLRAYGNGLCLAQVAEFVAAYLDRHTIDLRETIAGDLFEHFT